MPKINNWSQLGVCLMGQISGHTRQDEFDGEGDYQITSRIVEINEEEGWVQTQNTRYTLGKRHGGMSDG